mmetsp:Transcript_9388/g.12999  ORF Transcript_9388/g.12999 Transcript_9388/m.12999 type:complete len:313 (+) Transcript_9388:86-1024(+)
MNNFEIGLCEVGDPLSCVYSFLCTPCAMAQSRTALDSSGVCFNFFCLSLPAYRWMARTAYGIGDGNDFVEDCALSLFCPCCVTNQLYQTTAVKGNPTTDGGAQFNTNPMSPGGCDCGMCLYTCFCMPCSVGTVMDMTVGMPFLLGCCCMNVFSARNVIRYHYRLKGSTNSDCREECFVPYATYVCLLAASFCIPCAQYGIWAMLVAVNMALFNEAKAKGPGHSKAYLRGYNPGFSQLGPQVAVNYVQQQPGPVGYVSDNSLQKQEGYAAVSDPSQGPYAVPAMAHAVVLSGPEGDYMPVAASEASAPPAKEV